MEPRKGAKKSKKHRKHGRGKRKPGASRQRDRTNNNKNRELNRQRKLAGLPPVGPALAERYRANHVIRGTD